MELSEVNSLSESAFVRIFGNVVERHEGCALHLARLRPFQDEAAVVGTASAYLDSLKTSEVEEILLLHPDLAGKLADEGDLTAESQMEQREAGLRSISQQLTDELSRLNAVYKAKFGFPFIICARENKFEAILNGLRRRSLNSREEELQAAISEVKKIVSYRIKVLLK